MLTFLSHIDPGIYHFRYLARATTPGDFVVPPTRAECMYSPEVWGASAATRFVVGLAPSARSRAGPWRRARDVAPSRGVGLALLGLPVVLLVLGAALTPMPAELRVRGTAGSVRIEDRDGNLLREVRADDGSRARWMPLDEIGQVMQRAVLAAEDRRFFHHAGVDRRPRSGGMAGANASAHRLRRLDAHDAARPHGSPAPAHALGQARRDGAGAAHRVVAVEARVLEEYMNRVSFGPNLRGVAAASQAFFGKSPASLSAAEAALVAGMARGPSLYDLARRPDRARARRDRVLARMVTDGWLASDAGARARQEPMIIAGRRTSFGAPHLIAGLTRGDLAREQPGLEDALRSLAPIARVRTTIDTELQRMAETQVAATVGEFRAKGVTAASAVVVDNATGDVLAYVGSPDFFDEEHGGQNDGVRARRQPGSTLKPFVYELAMERLGYDPATALPDLDMHLDVGAVHDYAPHDYDGHVRGPVRLREALGNSLNIPAVWTAHAVGADPPR